MILGYRSGDPTEVKVNGVADQHEAEDYEQQYDRQQSAPQDSEREVVRETQEKDEVWTFNN